MRSTSRSLAVVFSLVWTVAIGGCGSGGSADESPTPEGDGNGSQNSAPTISGSPPPEATVDAFYTFQPSASDPDGDVLTFSVRNLPAWADFDSSTGAVSGTPTSGTEGNYADITITASDGSLSTAMASFAIEVVQVSAGNVTVTWDAPTTYNDGSALNDLTGYKIYYSTMPGTYANEVVVENPGVTTIVVENLAPNTYYFVATAINSAGLESGFSNVGIKTID